MWMIQRGDGACFALEARARVGARGERRREHFDGDIASEPRVARPINVSHTATAEGGHDFVRTEHGSGGDWQWRPRLYATRPANFSPALT